MKNIWNTKGNSQSPYAIQNVTGSGQNNYIIVFDKNSGKLIKDSIIPIYTHDDSIETGVNF
jgi:hypothetical protein